MFKYLSKNFSISKREPIEWTNTWIENSRDSNAEHFLFVGSSVTRELRREFTKLVDNPCDFIGTSSSFEDPVFYNIFNSFFTKNRYI